MVIQTVRIPQHVFELKASLTVEVSIQTFYKKKNWVHFFFASLLYRYYNEIKSEFQRVK